MWPNRRTTRGWLSSITVNLEYEKLSWAQLNDRSSQWLCGVFSTRQMESCPCAGHEGIWSNGCTAPAILLIAESSGNFTPGYQLNRRVSWPQQRSERFGEEKSKSQTFLCSPVNVQGLLINPWPDQEGNKLQRQKILMFIYRIYYHNWRNISTIYTYIYIYI